MATDKYPVDLTHKAWQLHERDRRRWGRSWAVFGGLVLIAVALPDSALSPHGTRFGPLEVGLLVAGALTQILVVSVVKFRCPRCGQRYYYRGEKLAGLFKKNCQNCGLSVGADIPDEQT